jgi:hypothetical protein
MQGPVALDTWRGREGGQARQTPSTAPAWSWRAGWLYAARKNNSGLDRRRQPYREAQIRMKMNFEQEQTCESDGQKRSLLQKNLKLGVASEAHLRLFARALPTSQTALVITGWRFVSLSTESGLVRSGSPRNITLHMLSTGRAAFSLPPSNQCYLATASPSRRNKI